LAVWLIAFVLLAEWRKAETIKLPVFTGVSEDSAIRQSANQITFDFPTFLSLKTCNPLSICAKLYIWEGKGRKMNKSQNTG